MIKNINEIITKSGWNKRIESNRLLIEKDSEFDIFVYQDLPYFAAPIHIHPGTQALEVNTDEFKAWHTKDEFLDDAVIL